MKKISILSIKSVVSLCLFLTLLLGCQVKENADSKPKQMVEVIKDLDISIWLKDYIPANYPNTKIDDHDHWFQAHIPDTPRVSWAFLPDKSIKLGYVHGLYKDKSLFIATERIEKWKDISGIIYFQDVGYYVTAYDSTTMGNWEVAKTTVVQFDGDSKSFVEKMVNNYIKYSKANEFKYMGLLNNYISANYTDAEIFHHNEWFQVFLPKMDLTISWGLVPQTKLLLKELEGLSEKKSIFIAKKEKNEWAEFNTVKYIEGAGYLIPEYDSKTMGEFDVARVTVVQFDGDEEKFVEEMAKAYKSSNPKSDLDYVNWLQDYFKSKYSTQKIAFHGGWYQTVLESIDLTVTWGYEYGTNAALGKLHGLSENKSLFIATDKKENWDNNPAVLYYKNNGYYILGYSSESMSDFLIDGCTVIQFDGNSKEFAKKIGMLK